MLSTSVFVCFFFSYSTSLFAPRKLTIPGVSNETLPALEELMTQTIEVEKKEEFDQDPLVQVANGTDMKLGIKDMIR